MTVKLLTEHHLEFLSLTGGFTGSSESIYVKVPHFWKSHVTTHFVFLSIKIVFALADSVDPDKMMQHFNFTVCQRTYLGVTSI